MEGAFHQVPVILRWLISLSVRVIPRSMSSHKNPCKSIHSIIKDIINLRNPFSFQLIYISQKEQERVEVNRPALKPKHPIGLFSMPAFSNFIIILVLITVVDGLPDTLAV